MATDRYSIAAIYGIDQLISDIYELAMTVPADKKESAMCIVENMVPRLQKVQAKILADIPQTPSEEVRSAIEDFDGRSTKL